MNDIECPYCEEDNTWNGDSLEQDEQQEMECEHCKKTFVFTASYHVHYSSRIAPCLNGEPHDWKPIVGYPQEYFEGKNRCSYCGTQDKR